MKPECCSAAKEQRLLSSSSSSTTPRKHLCVVYHCCSDESSNYEFKFYIVDPDSSSSEHLHLKPNIRLKGSEIDSPAVSFCSHNSTLYTFSGDVLHHHDPAETRRAAVTSFAAKFALTPQILSGLHTRQLEMSDLVRIKPMNQPKFRPIAVPTPDGERILVFSSEFYLHDSFEVYHADHDTWTLLPRLPLKHPRPRDEYHSIGAYGFQSESRFVVEVDDTLAFALDLQTMCWVQDFVWVPIPLLQQEGYFLGSDHFAFTSYAAYDVRDGLGPFLFDRPISKFPAHLHKDTALFDYYEDGAYEIAVVQAQSPSPYDNSLLVILDICQIDHVQFTRAFENFKRDMDKYTQRVHESLPDQPVFTTDACKTRDQFRTSFGRHKRDMKKYMEQCMRIYEQKGQPDMPLLNTTVSKTLKLLVGFDFDNYSYGTIHAFSI